MRDAGAEFGEVAQLLLRQIDLPEQRIGKDLVEFGEKRSSSAVARSRRSRS